MVDVVSDTLAIANSRLATTYSRPPFTIVRGEGVTLYDAEGRAYTDWVAGIAVNALGYGDPGLTAAIASAAGGLIHTSNLYYTEPQALLAQQLCDLSFADRVFFSNSGTEANEAAIKFARKIAHDGGVPGKTQIVAFDHAFHGRTMGSLAMTPKEQYQAPFRPLMPDVVIAPFNDLDGLDAIGERTCAVFLEPIQGEGGIHAASSEFLRAVRARCDAVGALLIFDEIQCGLGRTGQLWAHEGSGVTPDIMTIAKPLAGGLPMGAVLMTQAVANHIRPGDHGTTFGGGALVASVAQYVVGRLSDPALLAHVADTGAYLMDRLAEINSPLILDVRGRGLMVGIELAIDAAPVVEAGYAKGLLLVNAGPRVIRFVPPLIIGRAEVDALVASLTDILAQLGGAQHD